MQRTAKLFVVMGCAIAFGGMATAQTDSIMFSTSGNVTLNGVAVGGLTSIFTGDKLKTAKSSVAVVTGRGSSVKVNQDSSVEYKRSAVEIIQGSANVRTVNGMAAQVGDVTVVPKDGNADFEIVRASNEVSIRSYAGTLTLTDGSRTAMVAPGSATSFALKPGGVQSTAASAEASTHSAGTLVAGPFYSIGTPTDLPVCATALLCRRPNVSQIRPCVCRQP
jgi:hypothetical protein